MNILKKYFKQVLCIIAFAFLSILFALSPIMSTYAVELNSTNVAAIYKSFNSLHMPTNVVDASLSGSKLRIPLLNEVTGEYIIRVVDPAGQTHDCKIHAAEDVEDNYFTYTAGNSSATDAVEKSGYIDITSLNNGDYDIIYIISDGTNHYYSTPFTVKVENVSYQLEILGLVPNEVKTGTKITLPTAYVKNANTGDRLVNSETGKDVKAEMVVTKNGKKITTTTDVNEDGAVVTTENSDLKEEDGVYTLTLSKKGTYTVKFSYQGGNNVPAKTYTIVVTDDYTQPTKLTVRPATMPSVQLGQTGVTLPKLTINNEYFNDVDYEITKIRIEKRTEDGSPSTIFQELPANTLKFDMTTKAFTGANNYKELAGSYRITYYIKDAYGNTTTSIHGIDDITDEKNPDVYMSYNYDLNAGWSWDKGELKYDASLDTENKFASTPVKQKTVDEEEVDNVNTNYAVDLKANFGYGELFFPAIYASDSVSNYQDYKFVRYFQSVSNSNNKYYIDNLKLDDDGKIVKVEEGEPGYNYAQDENIGKFNKVVRYQFKESGADVKEFTGMEYSLRYYVVTNENSANTVTKQENYVYRTGTTSYTFKVVDDGIIGSNGGSDVVSTPTITINNVKNNSAINQNGKLNITVTAQDDLDKMLTTAMFYYTSKPKDRVLEDDVKSAISAVLSQYGAAETEGDLTINKLYYSNFTGNVLEDPTFASTMTGYGYTGFEVINYKDNKFNLELNLPSTVTDPITVFAVTVNDNGNIAMDSRTLKINDVTEANAPKAKYVDNFVVDSSNPLKDGEALFDIKNSANKFGQSKVVYLPTVTFDDEDKSLAISVKYYILTKAELDSLKNGQYPVVAYKYTNNPQLTYGTSAVNGGTITTSKIGMYYVVYTAIDDAGNRSDLTFSFEVEDTSNPVLDVEVVSEDTTQSGSTLTGEAGAEISFTPTLLASDRSSEIVDDTASGVTVDMKVSVSGSGWSTTANDSTFKFALPGQYTVTVTASYTKGGKTYTADSKVYFVTITVPELKWNFDADIPANAELDEEVILPYLTASQGEFKPTITVKVKDTTGTETILTEEKDVKTTTNGSKYWFFKASKKGTYTITYTASTDYGSITATYSVKAGDSVAPSFSFGAGVADTLQQDITYDGTNKIEYRIDYAKGSTRKLYIKVFSNGKEIYTVDTGLQLTDVDSDGKSSPFYNWSNLEMNLTTADGKLETGEESKYRDENGVEYTSKVFYINSVGKYSLQLTIKDSYENTATKTFNFNVVAKTDAKKVNDNVVGTVLIVVSLVILAGVILAFTLTGNKKGGASKKSRNTKNTAKTKEVKTEQENKVANEVVKEDEATEIDSETKSGDVE